MSKLRVAGCVLLCLLFVSTSAAYAQVDESLLRNLKTRSIGPALMGGRIADIAVVESNPSTFYVATAGGGVIKTINGGNTWEYIFEHEGTACIGDVTLDPTDPNVVWVGTGEGNNRQSSSWGDGIYKSTNGGKTWKHLGLKETHYINRIVIDPTNTDTVYAAALGHLWGPNAERGVFKTTDGGVTWNKVLFINEDTGITDIVIDPSNPKVLIAAAYQRRRSGWGFNGGGPNSGIYKTVDSGRTWNKMTAGLPAGDTGRIGLDIFRKNPNVLYATVENRNGGIFRSDDKGETWTKVSAVNPRPMYFSQIRIDPTDDKQIYVGGVQLYSSSDGGKTINTNASPSVHPDHHALWINPSNPDHLIDGNDGGIWVTFDKTKTWDHLNNIPLGQFYNVAADMQRPYNLYGGLQDNRSWGGPSATRNALGIVNDDWDYAAPGDGMYAEVDPTDPSIIYTNSQNGNLIRYDAKTGQRQRIQPQPKTTEPLRWNWTAPILISPHDSKVVYTGANVLFRSPDRGNSWVTISPDVTTKTDRDQLSLMGILGNDIQISRNDGMSSFGNITTISESPKRAGVVYVGTDDGNIQVTRDAGRTWANVSARITGVPKMIYVSRVAASSHDEGVVYASFDGHRGDDFAPHVYASSDYGQTWRSISANLPPGGPVYVVKEDPRNANVLYVGTEQGVFVSVNRGGSWTRWNTVPTVQVFDLIVHPRDNDLILATHGRSLMVIDDITPVQQSTENVLASNSHLFESRLALQFMHNDSKAFLGGREFHAPNPELGAYVNYYLKSAAAQDVKITIMDASGKTLRELTGPRQAGIHRVAWDLRASVGDVVGPLVLPGEYRVKIAAGGPDQIKSVKVDADPLVQITDADRRKLYDTLMTLANMQASVNSAVAAANRLATQTNVLGDALKLSTNAPASFRTAFDNATREIRDLQRRISGQAGPVDEESGGGGGNSLRGRIQQLKNNIDGVQRPPTVQQSAQFEEYFTELSTLTAQLNTLITTTMPPLFRQLNITANLGEPVKPPVK